jgi:EpsI family protein
MIKTSRFLALYALLGITALYLLTHSDTAVPMNKPFSEVPVQVGGWRMTSQQEFSEGVLNVLKPTDYLSRQYAAPDGRRVNLYLGYHSGGKDSGGIHSPKHCLPGSGWYEVSTVKTAENSGAGRINLVRAVYRNGENNEMFLYWFQVRDKSLNDEYRLKLAEIMNSVTSRRRDSTFVRISLPFETDQDKAEALGRQFIRDFQPIIREYLPK